jgi:hypothetical protein
MNGAPLSLVPEQQGSVLLVSNPIDIPVANEEVELPRLSYWFFDIPENFWGNLGCGSLLVGHRAGFVVG